MSHSPGRGAGAWLTSGAACTLLGETDGLTYKSRVSPLLRRMQFVLLCAHGSTGVHGVSGKGGIPFSLPGLPQQPSSTQLHR